jgi:hypothetical protein
MSTPPIPGDWDGSGVSSCGDVLVAASVAVASRSMCTCNGIASTDTDTDM